VSLHATLKCVRHKDCQHRCQMDIRHDFGPCPYFCTLQAGLTEESHMKRVKLQEGFVVHIDGLPFQIVGDAVVESSHGNMNEILKEPHPLISVEPVADEA
jgi:hypothetical protein